MVAYYGPGDTVTSFYALVGEQAYSCVSVDVLSMVYVGSEDEY